MKNKNFEKGLEYLVIFILNFLNYIIVFILSSFVYMGVCSEGYGCSGIIFFVLIYLPLLIIIPAYKFILKSFGINFENFGKVMGAIIMNISSIILSAIITYFISTYESIGFYIAGFFILLVLIIIIKKLINKKLS